MSMAASIPATLSPLPTQISAKHFYTPTTKSLIFPQIIPNSPKSRPKFRPNSPNSIKAYIENTNPISNFTGKVIASLPIIGLIARIINDEGGVGGDIIDFAEFRRRVGKNCTINDSRSFYEFQDRHGRSGDPLYVLLCCWIAAVGAGLLKSEEILEGVARLRVSNDIEFEEQNFIAKMNEARERRAKSKSKVPVIPMEIRAEKAVEAICVCCFGKDDRIEEEDERLMIVMVGAVFPSVERDEIERIVKDRVRKMGEEEENDGYGDEKFGEKGLPKEAIDMQLKDLEFLRQNSAQVLEKNREN